jgi:hypothetical protein
MDSTDSKDISDQNNEAYREQIFIKDVQAMSDHEALNNLEEVKLTFLKYSLFLSDEFNF